MIHVDILIVHGDVFTMAGNGSGYIGDGAVAITGNRIVETGTSESLSARYMTARGTDATDRGIHHRNGRRNLPVREP
ncbi:MAG: hypothetical protein AB2L13_05695 [Spirochaetota bacterium]|jgi:5-methylthioadenosine/S-adenosylhomocysteine deaminase